jgi:hypothetical protein
MEIVTFQQEFRPDLPNVYGTYDYRTFRDMFIKIDEVLTRSGLEHNLVSQAINQSIEKNQVNSLVSGNKKNLNYRYKIFRHALRCNLARHLTGESYRLFSLRLADSTLFQWFTGINAFGSRKAISKSALERYEKYFDEKLVAEKIRNWMSELSEEKKAINAGLVNPVSFDQTYMDSTCIEANIHYPVDWLLLRDSSRSLLSAIKIIRAQGLKHRMISPSLLMKKMNQLCIEMTHARRKKDSRKNRKFILRKMKKLSLCISKHAKRYRQLLETEWKKTELSEAQKQCVIGRIDNILEQLPAAIKQAHERIIGERLIRSSDKILSLYDKDVEVIVRGKSGTEVEFGQRLLLTEQKDGLIIDWELFAKGSPSDSDLLQPTINRLIQNYGNIGSTSTDRAFASAANDEFLNSKNIYNATSPKSPNQLQERLEDPIFLSLQTRRSQTEARIGIFKNVFLGKPLRSRITLNKHHAVNWCVLTHNLWVLSRKAIADEQSLLKKLKKAA